MTMHDVMLIAVGIGLGLCITSFAVIVDRSIEGIWFKKQMAELDRLRTEREGAKTE